MDCVYLIRVPHNKVVNITFTQFNLEASSGCRFDWIQVQAPMKLYRHYVLVNCTPNLTKQVFSFFKILFFKTNTYFFKIRNGPDPDSGHLGRRFCGHTLPGNNGTFITSHPVVQIRFVSDSSVAHLGFALVWSTADPVCGETYTGLTHGTIQSPGYPGQYPHNRDCTWTVEGDPGKRIQFHFATLRIETHPTCNFDVVEVIY